MAKKDPSLGKPIVEGLTPIRAEILHSVCEMAATIEDVLSRRIGLEFFSWKASREASLGHLNRSCTHNGAGQRCRRS